MTRDEHKTIIDSLMSMSTPENQADMSNLLSQLSEDYDSTLTSAEDLQNENNQLTENNEKLRKVNADLFLKVGNTKTDDNDNKKQNLENDLSFDDLFNEKGELI